MKTGILSPLLPLVILTLPVANADMLWDFRTNSDTTGWSSAGFDLEQISWEDQKFTGFNNEGETYAEENFLGVTRPFTKLSFGVVEGISPLASYVGGSISYLWTDSGQLSQDGSSEIYHFPEWVFFTGTLNGEEKIMGFELSLSSNLLGDGSGNSGISVDLISSNFRLIDSITYGFMNADPTVSSSAMSDEQFREFLSTCDGMYFRSFNQSAASGTGGVEDWVYLTQLLRVELKQSVIPEPATCTMGLLALLTLAARRRR